MRKFLSASLAVRPATGLIVCLMIFGTGACSRNPAENEAQYLTRGKQFRTKGEYDRAVLEFKNAIKAMPKDAEPYYQLALVHIAKGEIRTAYGLLTKATQLDPKHAGAQLQLAAFQVLGSSESKDLLSDAQARVQGVLANTPDDPKALDMLAITEYRMGKVDDARRDLEKALEKSPQQLKSAVNLAGLKLMQKDPSGAEAVLKTAVQSAPQSVDAALALAGLYIQTGRKSEAEAQVRRAVQLDPKDVSALKLLASFQMDAGQKDQAEQTYHQLSTLPGNGLKPLHAIFLFQQGKHDGALSELTKLVKDNPADRDLRGLLVSAYVTTGKRPEAERILSETLQRNAKDSDALMQRSAFYLDSGKIKEAQADLQSVLHYKPDSAVAHYGLARIEAVRGARLAQQQQLGEALRIDPKLLGARIELAALFQGSEPKSALRLLNEAPQWQKKELPYIVATNWPLLVLKDYAAVRKNLDSGLAVAKTPDLLYQDALLRFEEKDYSGARRSLEQTLDQNVENMPALNLLARTYAVQGDPSKALTIIQQYAAKKPKSPTLGSLIGIWQAQTRHLPEARQAFLDVIAANPNYMPARLALADIDVSTGNTDEARRALREVLTSQPDNIQAAMRLGSLELIAGNRSAAREHYQHVVQVDPDNSEALNNLAYTLADDKPDEALKYAQSAVERAPNSAAALDTLGWVYFRKGIYTSALINFKTAVAKEPTAVRKYHLALAYAKSGNPKLAQQHLEAALKLDPKLQMPEPVAR
jgi:tetratricopeptide (TPR) repeat protein